MDATLSEVVLQLRLKSFVLRCKSLFEESIILANATTHVEHLVEDFASFNAALKSFLADESKFAISSRDPDLQKQSDSTNASCLASPEAPDVGQSLLLSDPLEDPQPDQRFLSAVKLRIRLQQKPKRKLLGAKQQPQKLKSNTSGVKRAYATKTKKKNVVPSKVKQPAKKGQFVCKVSGCSSSFHWPSSLRHHVIRVHSVKRSFACPECKRTFMVLKKMCAHRMKQHGCREEEVLIHQCRKCGKRLQSERALRKHRQTHATRDPDGNFVCDHCGIKIKRYGCFSQHRTKCRDGIFVCAICGRAKTGRYRFMVHIRRHLELFTCEVCGMTIKTSKTFKNHMMTHTHKDQVNYVCDQCGYRSYCIQNLRNHQLIHLEKSVPCAFAGCTGMFKSPVLMRKHVKTTHGSAEASYVCEVCSLRFTSAPKLKYHRMKHTGERPFTCPIEGCHQSFTSKNHVRKHVRKVHKLALGRGLSLVQTETPDGNVEFVPDSAVPVYECQQCHQKFPTSAGLTRHGLSHGRVKSHVCHICPKAFTFYKDLRFHLGRIHNVPESEIPQPSKVKQSSSPEKTQPSAVIIATATRRSARQLEVKQSLSPQKPSTSTHRNDAATNLVSDIHPLPSSQLAEAGARRSANQQDSKPSTSANQNNPAVNLTNSMHSIPANQNAAFHPMAAANELTFYNPMAMEQLDYEFPAVLSQIWHSSMN